MWNPLKPKRVLNVGGAGFDETVGKAWWKGGLGRDDLSEMEEVIFLDVDGDWDAPTDEVGGGGWPPAAPGGGQPPGGDDPADLGPLADGMGLEEAEKEENDPDLHELLVWNEEAGEYQSPSSGDDEEEDEEEGRDGGEDVPAVRNITRGNRGVPATRYDDVFELAAEVMSPPNVVMALEGVRGAE